MQERRRAQRLPWTAKVQVSAPGSKKIVTGDARLRNISRSGFAFVTEDALTRGGQYYFRIELFPAALEVRGRLVHLKQDVSYFVCGVRIDQMGFFQRSALNRFLSSKSGRHRTQHFIKSLVAGLVIACGVAYFFNPPAAVTLIAFFGVTMTWFAFQPF